VNDGAGTTQFTHDALDRLTTITHPDLSTRTFTWNGRNQLLTVTNELSKTWTYAYRDNGQLESMTDPLPATTMLGYDARNRLTQVTDALSGVTGIAYDLSWQVSSITDPTLRVESFQHDLLGRLTGITDPGGETTTYGYDGDSRLTSVTDPLTHTWSYGYNSRDQLTSTTDPLTNTTSFGYDAVGRVTAINRPLGLGTTYTYDLRGLLTGETTGSASVGYAYTPLRQMDTFTDGEGHAWSRTHDPLGRLTAVTDPLLRSTTFSYDNRNRLTGMVHPEGSATFTYDLSSRLTQRSYSDGTVHNYTYDDVGRMLTTEGVTRTYDPLGRMTEENGILYGYDAAGRLETETYSTGHEVGHNFGLRGLPSQTTDWLSGVTSYTFDAAGNLTDLARPNGTSAHYTYDAVNRLVGLLETGPTDSLCSVELIRDALGRVTDADRRMPLSWAPETISRTYAYDPAAQVAGFLYDDSGRLLGDGTRSYSWDGASRVDSVNEGSKTIRYTPDGLDRVMQATPQGPPGVELLYTPLFAAKPDAGRITFGDGIRGARPPSGAGTTSPLRGFGGPEGEDDGGFYGRVSERLRHKDRAVAASDLESPQLESSALSVVREGGINDRTHHIHAPGGRPLHFIDLTGTAPTPRYYHFDEAGNVAFVTNESGAIVTSYAYSQSGESSSLGEIQPYPALTWRGMYGTTEESPTGLYRMRGSGSSFYDAVTTQDLPTHGSCGCKSQFTRSRIHAPVLPSLRHLADVALPPDGPHGDHPQEVLDLVAAATGDLHRSHPQEVLDLVAAATGDAGSSPQANRRYLYFAKVAALHHSRGKLLVGVDDVGLKSGNGLVLNGPPGSGSAPQANRRYLYFGKVADTGPGAAWSLESVPIPAIPVAFHGERATVEWIP
jgi:YD repeat-containing protein